MSWLLVLIAIAVSSIWLYFHNAFSYWSRRGVPCLPASVPWGNNKDLILQRCGYGEMCLRHYKKLKKPGRRFAGSYCFTGPELIVFDPDLAKQILSTDFKYFSDRGFYCNEKDEPLTASLMNLRGEKWKTLRQKLTPAFSIAKLKVIFQIMVANSIKLQKILHTYATNQEPCDVKDLSTRFALDTITDCGLGININSLDNPDNDFRMYTNKNFQLTWYYWMTVILSFVCPNVMKFLKLKKIEKSITQYYEKTVKDIVNYREKNNVERNDFLQLLINIKNSGHTDSSTITKLGGSFTLNEIIPQVFVFALGHETSASSITFFLYDMAINLEIQDKVRQEINDMLKKHNGETTYEGVNELPYLDKALKESMRMHSLISVLYRRCTEKYQIPGTDVILDKDTMVLIPLVGYHSDPEFYPNPEKFDPERFSSKEKDKRHICHHMFFGDGPRSCIAKNLGWLQTKAGIVAFMRNYKYTLNSKTKQPLELMTQSLFTAVKGGIWVNVEEI